MEPTNNTEIITTQTTDFWLIETGIIHGKIHQGAEQTLENAKENLRAIAKLAGGKLAIVLIDLKVVKSVNAEARAYYAGRAGAKIIKARGLLVGSPVSKVIGNFSQGLRKPLFPTKVFTNEEQALRWLKKFL